MKKAIVLAAGLGKRMGGKLPKVLYSIRNKPLIKILLSSVSSYFDEIIIVLGFKGELVKATLNSEYANLSHVVQKKHLGTADAVKSALLYINDDDDIFILNGDVPLLTMDSLKGMYEFHLFNSGVLTIGIIRIDDPTGYGRIIMDNEEIVKIVEEKDATEKEKSIDMINGGVYLTKGQILNENLNAISNNNAQGEYYLTTLVEILNEKSKKVVGYLFKNYWELLGVNTPEELKRIENYVQK